MSSNNNQQEEQETTTTSPENAEVKPSNQLSKNQIKKQKKLAEYEKIKKARRLKEREREKQKRAQGIPRTGPSRKELKKRQTAVDSLDAQRVAIDLDYDDLMDDRDVAKCVKQCLRIYTINRRSLRPCQLHFTGLKSDGRIHAGFKKNDGWQNWYIQYHFDETHSNVFPQSELVYLTCESDTVLEQLDKNKVYVIGGLVDHNHHKGLCHERATRAGLQTARLPLSEHVDMKTRSVLSTFHVFEILVRMAEGKSWTEAILGTLPSRKGAKAKQLDKETLGAESVDGQSATSAKESGTNVENGTTIAELKDIRLQLDKGILCENTEDGPSVMSANESCTNVQNSPTIVEIKNMCELPIESIKQN